MRRDLFAQKSYFNAFSNYIATADDIGDPVGDLIANAPNFDANTTYYLQVWDWDAYSGTYQISTENGSGER